MSSILNANVKGENILTIGVLIFILEKRTVLYFHRIVLWKVLTHGSLEHYVII